MNSHCKFVEARIDDVVREIASPIIARHISTGELYVCGTAVIIGRGLAMTASHVVQDFLQHFKVNIEPNGQINSSFEVLMYLSLNEGNEILPLKVLKMWPSTTFDIAILLVATPSDWHEEAHIWKLPKIQLLPPTVGEIISGFGFSLPSITQFDGEMPEIDLKSRVTTGKVIEIHGVSRDSVKLPFPCFRVDARFDESMSGGPVFNSAGNLCGIVCSSIPATEEHPEHISYVSTLWPMIGILVNPGNTPEIGEHDYFPMETYFDCGHIFAIDREHVRFERNLDTSSQVYVQLKKS